MQVYGLHTEKSEKFPRWLDFARVDESCELDGLRFFLFHWELSILQYLNMSGFFKEFILIWKKHGKARFFVFSIFQISQIKIPFNVHYRYMYILVQILRGRINFLGESTLLCAPFFSIKVDFSCDRLRRNVIAGKVEGEIKACAYTQDRSIHIFWQSLRNLMYNCIESSNYTSTRNLILLISSTILFFSILPTYEFYKLIIDPI